jgi:hypothetical protein
MRSFGAFALAAAPLLLVARADVELDGNDVPAACQSICRPIVELSRRCDASDRFDNDDKAEDEYERNEDQLRAQCFCSNDSFDVGMTTAFCGDCIRQNQRRDNDDDDDDDDNNDISDEMEDIGKIMATCGFTESAVWSPSQSDAADSFTVVATALTASSQLTTTYTGTWTSQALPLETGNRGGAESDNENGGDNNGDDGGDSMAAGGFSRTAVLYSLGAFAAGAAFLVL